MEDGSRDCMQLSFFVPPLPRTHRSSSFMAEWNQKGAQSSLPGDFVFCICNLWEQLAADTDSVVFIHTESVYE